MLNPSDLLTLTHIHASGSGSSIKGCLQSRHSAGKQQESEHIKSKKGTTGGTVKCA